MKATELRIGNWVEIQGLESKIISVDTEGCICENEYCEDFENNNITQNLQPIPLTEEWLKRLGFEIKKGAWGTSAEIRIGRVRYVLYQNRNVWSINPTDGFRVDFKYIHTVQNHYFALTGEELNQNKEDDSRSD